MVCIDKHRPLWHVRNGPASARILARWCWPRLPKAASGTMHVVRLQLPGSSTPLLHTPLLPPTVPQWRTACPLVRWAWGRGTDAVSRCGFPAGGSRDAAPLSWVVPSGQSEPRPWHCHQAALRALLTALTGGFHLTPAGCGAEGSALGPAPPRSQWHPSGWFQRYRVKTAIRQDGACVTSEGSSWSPSP